LSAGQLYEFCTSKEPVATSACRFFILGAVLGIGFGDGAIMGPDRQVRERKKTLFCIPDDMSQSQMVSIFVNTMRLVATKYPDDLKMPAISAVGAYMNGLFRALDNKPSYNNGTAISYADGVDSKNFESVSTSPVSRLLV
jgi:hypothetical protein